MFTVCVDTMCFSNYEVGYPFEARGGEIWHFSRNTIFMVLLYSEQMKMYKLYSYVCTTYATTYALRKINM